MPTEPTTPETLIERLIDKCGRNPFLVMVFVIAGIGAGIFSLKRTPLDAIPDLSDTQVIINTTWMGRSPDLVEDQVTYPIVTALLGAPRVKYVRGTSMLGESFVYVVFQDGTDLYWARTRVSEKMQMLQGQLPEGAMPTLGPDATALGWVFEYALRDTSGKNDLQQLRSFQDWYLRPYLRATPGVADVASVGGYVKQYQVELDPIALRGYGVGLNQVVDAIRKANNDVGGRLLEANETELIVSGRGYIKSIADIEQVAVSSDDRGVPILVKQIGRVHLGPEIRRGLVDLDGQEVVGGIIIMRDDENALNVIRSLKERIEAYQPSFPAGAELVVTYDRSELIHSSIETLREELVKLSVIVSLVCIVFLFHFRSALVAILTLPIAILLSFVPMLGLGLTSNIMSLGGIAIAIGAMVDSAIIMIENAHKQLEHFREEQKRDPNGSERIEVILSAAKSVGRPLFFSLLVITVSFIPVFTLEAQEGRLFRPLAFTKTFAMFFASLLGVTLVPVLMVWFIRGKIRPEAQNPLNRFLIWAYQPFVNFVLRFRWFTIAAALLILALTIIPLRKLGQEFMPDLNEGAILYMPTAPSPSLAIGEAREILQMQDRIIADKETFPEVQSVFGKIGRAETATDPAPLNMVETTIVLKPVPLHRWYSSFPEQWQKPLRKIWPDKGLADSSPQSETVKKLNAELPIPGMPVIPWQPIQTRRDMLATGVRSPVGVKVFGSDLKKLEELAKKIEVILRNLPGTETAFAEPLSGAYYVDITLRRDEIARYGLSVAEVEDVIESAIGGKNISTTIEGRERYPINVRYARDFRKDIEALKNVTIAVGAMEGANEMPLRQIPLGQLAAIRISLGAPEIKNEGGQLLGLVHVKPTADQPVVGYVERARLAVEEGIDWKGQYTGYHVEWAGQYQYWQRAKEKLLVVVPFTLLIIFVLIYMNTKSLTKTAIVLLAVPFSLVGAFWLLYLLDYNLSVAVWVGIIALAGLDAETGVVMLLYLDHAWEKFTAQGRMKTVEDLKAAIKEGAVLRVRPKIMTVCAILFGLLPILWSLQSQAGADVMKRIAAPMVGGVVTSGILELLIYPTIFFLWRSRHLPKK